MIDSDEIDYPDPDDYWDDDLLAPAKDEPDCYACNDTGFIYLEGDRRCRSCNPTRLQHRWWLHTWRVKAWLSARWHRVRGRLRPELYDDEPPF